MQKEQLSITVIGIELKKSCPLGLRNRIKRWLNYNNEKKLFKNLYLLEEDKYWIWQEYFIPLIKNFGKDFAYSILSS